MICPHLRQQNAFLTLKTSLCNLKCVTHLIEINLLVTICGVLISVSCSERAAQIALISPASPHLSP